MSLAISVFTYIKRTEANDFQLNPQRYTQESLKNISTTAYYPYRRHIEARQAFAFFPPRSHEHENNHLETLEFPFNLHQGLIIVSNQKLQIKNLKHIPNA